MFVVFHIIAFGVSERDRFEGTDREMNTRNLAGHILCRIISVVFSCTSTEWETVCCGHAQ